jgi:hypothetical protein
MVTSLDWKGLDARQPHAEPPRRHHLGRLVDRHRREQLGRADGAQEIRQQSQAEALKNAPPPR